MFEYVPTKAEMDPIRELILWYLATDGSTVLSSPRAKWMLRNEGELAVELAAIMSAMIQKHI